MKYVKGNLLTPELKRQVLSRYVHRHLDTACKTDNAWLASKSFLVTKNNQLAKHIAHCFPAFFADTENGTNFHGEHQ